MRISDWSSDVCSSDLGTELIASVRNKIGNTNGYRINTLLLALTPVHNTKLYVRFCAVTNQTIIPRLLSVIVDTDGVVLISVPVKLRFTEDKVGTLVGVLVVRLVLQTIKESVILQERWVLRGKLIGPLSGISV